MQLIHGLANLQQLNTPCVASIGSFDALHLGHQAIIQNLKQRSKYLNLPTAVMLFEPQPREFFSPEKAPPRVLRLRDKIAVLESYEIDYVICLRFDAALAALTKDAFVAEVVVKAMQAKHLVIGDDFRFGKGRAGDFQYLQTMGKQYGFNVEPTPTVQIDTRRVSSTWVREALRAGDFQLVEKLLRRPYQLRGKVQRCDQRGRQLGFPTANIGLEHDMALRGVYVVQVEGVDQLCYGVANIGMRPTVDGLKRMLEVYILNFDQDIYGHTLEITFLKQLRQEQKFATVDDLVKQIRRDVQAATTFLNTVPK